MCQKNHDYNRLVFSYLLFFSFRKSYCLKEVAKLKPNEPVQLKQGEHVINNIKYECRFGYEQEFEGFLAHFVKGHQAQILNLVERQLKDEKDPKSEAFMPEGARIVRPDEEMRKQGIYYLRNHPTLNNHIKELLIIWMANVDTKFILHPEQLEEYVTKYCCKDEKPSHHFANVLRASIAKCNPNSTVRSACQKALIQGNVRDVSRQEAFMQLEKSLAYVDCSQSFRMVSLTGNCQVDLNCNDPKKKVTKKDDVAETFYKRKDDPLFLELCKLYETDHEAFCKKLSPKYANPKHPNDICLYEFVAFYNCNWKPCRTDTVPIFSPYFLKPPSNTPKKREQYERFCRTNLLVYKPGCTRENILENFGSLDEALRDFVKNSPHCPSFLKADYGKAQISTEEEAQISAEEAGSKETNEDAFPTENKKEDDDIEKVMAGLDDYDEEDEDDRLYPNLCPQVPEDTDYDSKLNRQLIILHQRRGEYDPSEEETEMVLAQQVDPELPGTEPKVDIVEDYYDTTVIQQFQDYQWDKSYHEMELTPELLKVKSLLLDFQIFANIIIIICIIIYCAH